MELVQSSNGNTRRADDGGLQNENPKHTRNTRRGERKKVTVVPAHCIQTDTSDVREETFIFANMVFCILLITFARHSFFSFLSTNISELKHKGTVC